METIPREILDPFYRYKRHILQMQITKHETLITNLDQVAKNICRNPEHLAKWFSLNIKGSPVKVQKLNGVVILSLKGNPTLSTLEDILEKFIEKYVICPVCKLPETKYMVDSTLNLQCEACGNNQECKSNEPFVKFILNENTQIEEAQENEKSKKAKRLAKNQSNSQ